VTVHAPRPDYHAFQHVPNQTEERVNEGTECVQANTWTCRKSDYVGELCVRFLSIRTQQNRCVYTARQQHMNVEAQRGHDSFQIKDQHTRGHGGQQ
jgi:hypothetical protein